MGTVVTTVVPSLGVLALFLLALRALVGADRAERRAHESLAGVNPAVPAAGGTELSGDGEKGPAGADAPDATHD